MPDFEDVQFLIGNIARTLTLISTADLEAWNRECRESLNRWHSVGHILDPTAYRDMSYSGQLDDLAAQLEIATHLLAARKAIDEREKIVAEAKERAGG